MRFPPSLAGHPYLSAGDEEIPPNALKLAHQFEEEHRLNNAMAESFFASLECELIDRKTFKTRTEARLPVFTWIEGWYNPRRRHSALGYFSPVNFERRSISIPESDVPPNEPEHTTIAWESSP